MRKQPQHYISGTTPDHGIKKPSPPPAPPKTLREGNEKRCGTNPEPSTPRPTTPPQGTTNYEKLLTRLLLKVNHVTCYHRHGNPIPKSALDELARFQEEIEDIINE